MYVIVSFILFVSVISGIVNYSVDRPPWINPDSLQVVGGDVCR